MINAIGEAGLQQATRPQYQAAVQTEETLVQERERLEQERPVEQTEDSQGPEMGLERKDASESTFRNRIEEGEVIVEQYDDKGRLVKLNPPGYLPMGETV